MEPNWQTFGNSKKGATADLIWLVEWLGCRDKPRALPLPEVVCLMRGAPAVLAAVDMAGGVHALAAADMDAATCLAQSLMDATYNPCRKRMPSEGSCRVLGTFAPLGPRMLSEAAAQMRRGVADSAKRASTAVQLTEALLATDIRAGHPDILRSSRRQQASGVRDRACSHDTRAAACRFRPAMQSSCPVSLWLRTFNSLLAGSDSNNDLVHAKFDRSIPRLVLSCNYVGGCRS